MTGTGVQTCALPILAGGIGYGKEAQALKDEPSAGDKIVIMGGDNYRIGMGGAAVSSADTGEFSTGIELNAGQRSNPEKKKKILEKKKLKQDKAKEFYCSKVKDEEKCGNE